MKQIRNVTRHPVKVPLSGGKTLHLGPSKIGQVADDSIARESFRKLVEVGAIEVLGEGRVSEFQDAGLSSPHEATHGHHPPTGTLTRGNR